MPNKDYYKILGVDENASQDTIKKAYRKLAKENHPDTHPGDKQAEERFKNISEAYSVLSDPNRRKQYDQMRKYGYAGQGTGGGFRPGEGVEFDLSDLFGSSSGTSRRRGFRQSEVNLDDFFGFGGLGDLFSQIFEREEGFGKSGFGAQRGQDIQVALEVPFDTAVRGGKATFSVTKERKCPDCKGTGAKKGKRPDVCTECRGTGMISRAQGGFAVSRPCPRCLGRGQIIKDPCTHCRGSGRVRGPKKYSINIAPGTEDGKKLRLRGEGNPGANGQPSGDLLLTLRVGKHRFFRKEGLDIHCEIPIDEDRAKKGTKVKVKTVHGNSVVLKVPPKTQSGRVFRLKGMGVKQNGEQGDQYVTIRVS